jgi:hypothetical protein
VEDCCEHGNEPSGSINFWEILLLKKLCITLNLRVLHVASGSAVNVLVISVQLATFWLPFSIQEYRAALSKCICTFRRAIHEHISLSRLSRALSRLKTVIQYSSRETHRKVQPRK